MVLLFAGTPIGAQRSKTRKKARQEQTIKTPTPKWAAGTTTKQKKVLRELINNMVLVDGGTFTMGATSEQMVEKAEYEKKYKEYGDWLNNSKPTHKVTLSDYYICKYEVTQELWYAVMDPKKTKVKEDVAKVNISWNDCQTFIEKLNKITGLEFRFPTEAEWEYAARGGKKSKGYTYSGTNNKDDINTNAENILMANAFGEEKTDFLSIGFGKSNELGLYNMNDNVQEWCSDWSGLYSSEPQTNPQGPTSSKVRIVRGSSWGVTLPLCLRGAFEPNVREEFLGLRLAMSSKKAKTTAKNSRATTNKKSTATSKKQGTVKEFNVKGVPFKMVYVAGGTFMMGATAEQDGYERDETPAHRVTLSGYYIGQTEVTQELWYAVMGTNPSKFTRSSLNPVEKVSWDDCQTFIQKLNQLTGKKFRLPTEAEWEYAARGGNKSNGYKYSGSNSIGEVAWYEGNSGNVTHEVGTKAPNELGLYDMTGNVWEWCSDWYGSNYYSSVPSTNPTGPTSGSARVVRGGSWLNNAQLCRVSYRSDDANPANHYSTVGFRLVLDR